MMIWLISAPYSFDTNTINELMETEAMSIKEKLEHFAQMMREHNVSKSNIYYFFLNVIIKIQIYSWTKRYFPKL